MSYIETIDILDGRKQKSNKITARELEVLRMEDTERSSTMDARPVQQTYRYSVAATKIHIHGTPCVDLKEDNTIRFLDQYKQPAFLADQKLQSRTFKAHSSAIRRRLG